MFEVRLDARVHEIDKSLLPNQRVNSNNQPPSTASRYWSLESHFQPSEPLSSLNWTCGPNALQVKSINFD
jgi:hypothetical protein